MAFFLGSGGSNQGSVAEPIPIENIKYPHNRHWTIYGRQSKYIYAQPSFLQYPLYIQICIEPRTLHNLGEAPDGVITSAIRGKNTPSFRFYRQALRLLKHLEIDQDTYKSLEFNCSRYLVMRGIDGVARSELEVSNGNWGLTNPFSLVFLRNLYRLAEEKMPAVAQLTELKLRAWLHDSVSLVEYMDKLWAFKTNRNAGNLYQELETLLKLPEHPNIISSPAYLVTKVTEFSRLNPMDAASKYLLEPTQPIIGFMTPYHPGGTLKSRLRRNHSPHVELVARWTRQLTAALEHIFRSGYMYTGLKMDNIVLDSEDNLVLIDFEHAGTRIQYTPPEVLCWTKDSNKFVAGPKYHLSRPPQSAGQPCGTCAPHPCAVPPGSSMSECYNIHMEILSWRFSPVNILSPRMPNSRLKIVTPEVTFWTGAAEWQKEAAMVWMLACCLWCILEGCPCLCTLGREWLPIPNPYWKKSKDKVPAAVLEIVDRCFEMEEHKRPSLEELLVAMKKWEAELEVLASLQRARVEYQAWEQSHVGKRQLSGEGSMDAELKKRRVDDLLEWVEHAGAAANTEMEAVVNSEMEAVVDAEMEAGIFEAGIIEAGVKV